MIIKSFEIDKINVKSNNFYLFYGENEGYKNESIEKIFNINISQNIYKAQFNVQCLQAILFIRTIHIL